MTPLAQYVTLLVPSHLNRDQTCIVIWNAVIQKRRAGGGGGVGHTWLPSSVGVSESSGNLRPVRILIFFIGVVEFDSIVYWLCKARVFCCNSNLDTSFI